MAAAKINTVCLSIHLYILHIYIYIYIYIYMHDIEHIIICVYIYMNVYIYTWIYIYFASPKYSPLAFEIKILYKSYSRWSSNLLLPDKIKPIKILVFSVEKELLSHL